MKKTLKLLSALLALIMLVSVFASCGSNEEEENTSDSVTDTSETETSAASEEVIKIINEEQFVALVNALNESPESSKGKYYKLFVDINYVVGWDASPTAAYGKLQAPETISAFPGISEFYGTFDGNGKTISAVYRVGAEGATVVGGFIDKLNGGTVKNLTLNNSYVFASGCATVGGLIGTVNGDGATVENVTVNANIYSANDASAVVGGIVGAVEANGFTMTKSTFGGKAGNVAVDLTIPSASASAKLAQLVGNAGDKAVTLTECAANGDLIAADGAAKEAYANGSAVTNNSCTITAPAITGVVEVSEYKIYTAEELLAIAAYNSTYEGKTVKLMADINLNEEWTASAAAPATVWTGIKEFKGTLDGNGKFLRGIYCTGNGFIEVLNGGTVKNLAIVNSALVYSAEAASNVGVIGTANGGTVEAVYSELEIYVSGSAEANVGGIIGETVGAVTVKDVVFNGEISADGKTVDQIIAKQSTASVVSDVLAIGTGAVSTDGRTSIFTDKQSAAPAESTWERSSYLESFVPKSIQSLLSSLTAMEADISWYDDAQSEFTLTTPAQLLGLSKLAQTVYDTDGVTVLSEGKTFEGKTIKLGADIDLNPNWDAATTVSSTYNVTLARKPLNEWVPIPLFKGKIDGQGHTVSGLYSSTTFDAPIGDETTPIYLGGFIVELIGGEIKNIIIDNGLVYFTSASEGASTGKVRIGGLIARVVDSTLDTMYVDVDAWLEFKHKFAMAGMILEFDTADYTTDYQGTVKNLVYAGSTGRIIENSDGFKNCKTSTEVDGTIYAAGMLGVNLNANSTDKIVKLKIDNISVIGVFYCPIVTAGGFDRDPHLANSNTEGKYNYGICADNVTVYVDKYALAKNGETEKNANTTSAKVGETATDVRNRESLFRTDTTQWQADKYTADNWSTITIENGAGITEPILLPKTVVNMLNARNA